MDGLLVHAAQLPPAVPVQPLRYSPIAQFAWQLLHTYPLPSAWLQVPERYEPEAHVWLSQAAHDPSVLS